MDGMLLRDGLGHHVWATLRLLETCRALHGGQLAATAEGTFGSVIDTLRHIVGADAAYLSLLLSDASFEIDEAELAVPELAAVMERNGSGWATLLAGNLDPDQVVVRHRSDGSESHAPLGVRLAQALHHGADHRSQVCTILTQIGVLRPAIDVWDYAQHQGRLTEVPGGD